MKHLIFNLILTSLSITSFCQSRKVLNDLGNLTLELVAIKSDAQAFATDIKHSWVSNTPNIPNSSDSRNSNSSNNIDTASKLKTPRSDTVVKVKNIRGSSGSSGSRTTAPTTTKSSSKISNNDTSNKNPIPITPKGPTSVSTDPMKDVKDTLRANSQVKYQQILSSVDGLIATFDIAIKKPSALNDEQFKEQINKSLLAIQQKQSDFKTYYLNGTLRLLKGPGMTPIDPTGISTIIEVGVDIYKAIVGISDANRLKVANDFKQSCSLKPWTDL